MLKPRSLCRAPESVFPFYRRGISDADFFQQLKISQLQRLAAMQLQVRLATVEDIPRIDQLVFSRYEPKVAAEISPFDTYRYIRFGQVLLVEDAANSLAACAYEVGYDHPDRPSYLLRLVVRQDMEAKGLATLLNRLASAMAYERGARSRHALLDHSNPVSLYVHLNKVGSYFIDLIDVPCEGILNHFVSARPLTAQTLAENVIDDRLLMVLDSQQTLPLGCQWVEAQDLPSLKRLLRQDGLTVIAATCPPFQSDPANNQKLLLTRL